MQASSCSYRATRLAPFLLLALLSTARCTPQKIWDRPIAEVQSDIATGNWDFLRGLSFTEVSAADALRLGEDAPYHLGLAFRDIGRTDNAIRMQQLQITHGDTRWHGAALLEILQMRIEREEYDDVISEADRYLETSAGTDFDRIRKSKIEALYWTSRDTEVIQELDMHFPTLRSSEDPSLDEELALYAAVSLARLGRNDWMQAFVSLFTNHRASLVHLRAKRFLELDEEKRAAIGQTTWRLIEGKAAFADGRLQDALQSLSTVLPENPRLAHETLIREVGSAYQTVKDFQTGADLLDGLLPELGGRASLAAEEMIGRLLRDAGAYTKAAQHLDRVLCLTDDNAQKDRVLWFQLDMMTRISTEAALEWIEGNADRWSHPPYFDDLVEVLTTRIFVSGDREALTTLFRALEPAAPPSRIRIYYILRRWGIDQVTQPAPQAGVKQDYYRLLLSHIGDAAAPPPPPIAEPGILDHRVDGLLKYGQLDRAYRLWRDKPREVGAETERRLAGALSRANRHRAAIGLIGSAFPWSAGEYHKLAFPQAYRLDLERAAKDEGIPVTLFYALAKEESAFQADVVSRAGAIGLTQLMPETAADEARRMRLDGYNLEDPKDNLMIGAHHLGRLVGRLESISLSLMAYNAGLNRVRQWQRQYPELPYDLLTEALPFQETRHYIRKLLVSTAAYDALYRDQDPRNAIDLFYPQLAPPQ